MIYLPGKDNTLADALSREEWPPNKITEDSPLEGRLAAGDVEAPPPQEED